MRQLTSVSPSPTHLLVKLAALTLKNVVLLSVAQNTTQSAKQHANLPAATTQLPQRTSCSPSPTHLLVKLAALTFKNEALLSVAITLHTYLAAAAHQLLSLANPFAGQAGCADVEKCGSAFCCQGFCKHCLAVAWRAIQQDASHWRAQA